MTISDFFSKRSGADLREIGHDELAEGHPHVATRRPRSDDKRYGFFMRPRRSRATCSSPRRGGHGVFELT